MFHKNGGHIEQINYDMKTRQSVVIVGKRAFRFRFLHLLLLLISDDEMRMKIKQENTHRTMQTYGILVVNLS